MKSAAVKFLAIVLATLFFTTAIVSGLGILFLMDQKMYEKTPEQTVQEFTKAGALMIASDFATRYAAQAYGNCPQELEYILPTDQIPAVFREALVSVGLSGSEAAPPDVQEFVFTQTVDYPKVFEIGDAPSDWQDFYYRSCTAWVDGQYREYVFCYYPDQTVTLEIAVRMRTVTDPPLELAGRVYVLRDWLPLILLGSLLLLAACLTYLCWAAGRKRGQEAVCPGGLNRLPIDLYAGIVVTALMNCLQPLANWLHWAVCNCYYIRLNLLLMAACCFGLCLLPVCLIFAFAAQVKTKGYLWPHSVTGWCLIRVWRGVRWCLRGLRALFRLLPVCWQWLLIGLGFGGVALITLLGRHALAFFACVLAGIALVLYGGYCFGTLMAGAKEMAAGNLNRKINTRYLFGAFADCAAHLNALADAAELAARKQLKSERMKTELITNVTHDIKTPLTSLINYVDLLEKPHTEEEGAAYIGVLSRQSQRLKKLIDDLIELSKASTGNVPVELADIDAAEAVRQALGEFSCKLSEVPLETVLTLPEDPVRIRADGRLIWRVMSNLLSNAVKYAMPGTRLYVDVTRSEGNITISFKNISREALNVSAGELMERFVRGDASRNTEGSGLGLNIAHSLMRAQGGDLRLLVDGDLFKATLFFPGA